MMEGYGGGGGLPPVRRGTKPLPRAPSLQPQSGQAQPQPPASVTFPASPSAATTVAGGAPPQQTPAVAPPRVKSMPNTASTMPGGVVATSVGGGASQASQTLPLQAVLGVSMEGGKVPRPPTTIPKVAATSPKIKQGVQHAERAYNLDTEGQLGSALTEYRAAINCFVEGLGDSKLEDRVVEEIQLKTTEYVKRVDVLVLLLGLDKQKESGIHQRPREGSLFTKFFGGSSSQSSSSSSSPVSSPTAAASSSSSSASSSSSVTSPTLPSPPPANNSALALAHTSAGAASRPSLFSRVRGYLIEEREGMVEGAEEKASPKTGPDVDNNEEPETTDKELTVLVEEQILFNLSEEELKTLLKDYESSVSVLEGNRMWDIKGRLYVYGHFLCFHSTSTQEQKIVQKIPFATIITLQKKRSLLSGRLEVTTIDQGFHSFGHLSLREDWFEVINHTWQHCLTKTKLFGVPLRTVLERENRLLCGVPLFVETAIEFIKQHGLKTMGIFRISAEMKKLELMASQLDRGLGPQFSPDDVHSVCAVLKKYFRDLPEPLLTFELYNCFMAVHESIKDPALLLEKIESLVSILPRETRLLTRYLFGFLDLVASHAESNKMPIDNLALIFGPILLGTDESLTSSEMIAESQASNHLVLMMLKNHVLLFEN